MNCRLCPQRSHLAIQQVGFLLGKDLGHEGASGAQNVGHDGQHSKKQLGLGPLVQVMQASHCRRICQNIVLYSLEASTISPRVRPLWIAKTLWT